MIRWYFLVWQGVCRNLAGTTLEFQHYPRTAPWSLFGLCGFCNQILGSDDQARAVVYEVVHLHMLTILANLEGEQFTEVVLTRGKLHFKHIEEEPRLRVHLDLEGRSKGACSVEGVLQYVHGPRPQSLRPLWRPSAGLLTFGILKRHRYKAKCENSIRAVLECSIDAFSGRSCKSEKMT